MILNIKIIYPSQLTLVNIKDKTDLREIKTGCLDKKLLIRWKSEKSQCLEANVGPKAPYYLRDHFYDKFPMGLYHPIQKSRSSRNFKDPCQRKANCLLKYPGKYDFNL